MESILNTIKKKLGITEDYDVFDTDIIVDINSVNDASETWDMFIPEDPRLNDVKTYIYMKVRLLFDPPTSSAAIASMEKLISEFEWRLNVAAETCDCS